MRSDAAAENDVREKAVAPLICSDGHRWIPCHLNTHPEPAVETRSTRRAQRRKPWVAHRSSVTQQVSRAAPHFPSFLLRELRALCVSTAVFRLTASLPLLDAFHGFLASKSPPASLRVSWFPAQTWIWAKPH